MERVLKLRKTIQENGIDRSAAVFGRRPSDETKKLKGGNSQAATFQYNDSHSMNTHASMSKSAE
jgi:hypothetical protein